MSFYRANGQGIGILVDGIGMSFHRAIGQGTTPSDEQVCFQSRLSLGLVVGRVVVGGDLLIKESLVMLQFPHMKHAACLCSSCAPGMGARASRTTRLHTAIQRLHPVSGPLPLRWPASRPAAAPLPPSQASTQSCPCTPLLPSLSCTKPCVLTKRDPLSSLYTPLVFVVRPVPRSEANTDELLARATVDFGAEQPGSPCSPPPLHAHAPQARQPRSQEQGHGLHGAAVAPVPLGRLMHRGEEAGCEQAEDEWVFSFRRPPPLPRAGAAGHSTASQPPPQGASGVGSGLPVHPLMAMGPPTQLQPPPHQRQAQAHQAQPSEQWQAQAQASQEQEQEEAQGQEQEQEEAQGQEQQHQHQQQQQQAGEQLQEWQVIDQVEGSSDEQSSEMQGSDAWQQQQQQQQPEPLHTVDDSVGASGTCANPLLAPLQARLDALLGDFTRAGGTGTAGVGANSRGGASAQAQEWLPRGGVGQDLDDEDGLHLDGIQVQRVTLPGAEGGRAGAAAFKNALPPPQQDFTLTYS